MCCSSLGGDFQAEHANIHVNITQNHVKPVNDNVHLSHRRRSIAKMLFHYCYYTWFCSRSGKKKPKKPDYWISRQKARLVLF